MKHTTLRKAKLQKAVLKSIDLRRAQLDGADLSQAELQKADLRAAVLKGATYAKAVLKEAIFSKRTVLPFSNDEAKRLGMVLTKAGGLFVMWDSENDPELSKLKTALEKEGIEVQLAMKSADLLDGSDPLDEFSAVLHLAGEGYSRGMNEKMQLALVKFVRDGGTYIGTAWIGFMLTQGYLTKMTDLVLVPYDTSNSGKIMLKPMNGVETDPLLEGLKGEVPVDATLQQGHLISFNIEPARVLLRDPDGYDIVAARHLGSGNVVNLGFVCTNSSTLSQVPIQRLILNAVNL